jgi:hypothetical protein
MECRICFDAEETPTNNLLHPCLCKGTQKWIHDSCLRHWYFLDKNNDRCSVCKYKYEIGRGANIIIVPPDLEPFRQNLLLKGIVGYMQNIYIMVFGLALFFETQTIYKHLFAFHSAYQALYTTYYALFCWARYVQCIKNKKLYWSFLDKDVKQLLLIHGVVIFCLPFMRTYIFHIAGIFLLQYAYGLMLYYHYVAAKELNQLVPIYFINYSAC